MQKKIIYKNHAETHAYPCAIQRLAYVRTLMRSYSQLWEWYKSHEWYHADSGLADTLLNTDR